MWVCLYFSTLCMRRTFVYLLNCSENNNNHKKKQAYRLLPLQALLRFYLKKNFS